MRIWMRIATRMPEMRIGRRTQRLSLRKQTLRHPHPENPAFRVENDIFVRPDRIGPATPERSQPRTAVAHADLHPFRVLASTPNPT